MKPSDTETIITITPLILIGAILVIIAVLASAGAQAEGDVVFICSGEDCREPVDRIYVNESWPMISITFSQNCTNWSIETLESSLLAERLRGVHVDDARRANETVAVGMQVDGSARVGEHELGVWLNYTREDGSTSCALYNLSITYLHAIELLEVNVPEGHGRIFSVDVETHVRFDSLIITFDADGGIEADTEEIVFHDLEAGLYRFETELVKASYADMEPQVLFVIDGKFDNRSISIVRKDIEVELAWNGEPGSDGSDGNPSIWFAISGLIIAAVLVNYYFFIVRRNY